MSDIASWAFLIGVLLVLALPLALAIASLWLWGGARRGALGHLMAGAFLLVTGAIFIYVTWINVFARMDDLWSWDNTGFGEYFMLLGVILLIGSLAGYGVHPWLVALLVVASAMFGDLRRFLACQCRCFPQWGSTSLRRAPAGRRPPLHHVAWLFHRSHHRRHAHDIGVRAGLARSLAEKCAPSPQSRSSRKSTSTSRPCSTLATYSSASSLRLSSSSPGASSRASCVASVLPPSLRLSSPD